MLFILGLIVGLLVAILIFTILAFFRGAIERRIKIIERVLQEKGPKPQGYIFEPPDDLELARQEIIERNNREGKDTPLSDLL